MQPFKMPDNKRTHAQNDIVEESSPIEDDIEKTFPSPVDLRTTKEFDQLSEGADGIVGKILNNHFEILSLVGEGGMSHVYKAMDLLLHRVVAVKMLRPHLLQQPNAIRRLQQEARATSHLDHPNCVGIRHFDVAEDGTSYLVMDFVEGRSLAEITSEEGRFKPDRAVIVFLQIGHALAHAHGKGIIHRDLKSNNVLLLERGDATDLVKIVDFGIARLIAPDAEAGNPSNVTMTGEIFGSPLAMSPEQCRGEKADARSDIYSFGCLMYEMLTGRPVFLAKNSLEILFKQLHDVPDNFKVANASAKIPPRLETIVFKALQKDPKNRYQSMEKLIDDLQALHKTSAIELAAARVTLAAQNTRRNKNVIWKAVCLALTATVFFLSMQHLLLSEKALLDVVVPWQTSALELENISVQNRTVDSKEKESAIRDAEAYMAKLKLDPSYRGALKLTRAEACTTASRLRDIAERLYATSAYDELKRVAVSAGLAASTYGFSLREQPGLKNVLQGKSAVQAMANLGDDLYKAKLFEPALNAYGTAIRVSEAITGPNSSDVGYFKRLCGDCYYRMAADEQDPRPGTYASAAREYLQFLDDPTVNRVLTPNYTSDIIQQQKVLSYLKRADSLRMSELTENKHSDDQPNDKTQNARDVIYTYKAGLQNDQKQHPQNVALCHAYMAALVEEFDLPPEAWELGAHNPLGSALSEMQKNFGASARATRLTECEYAKSLWHHANKLVVQGRFWQATQTYFDATTHWWRSKAR